MRLLIGEVTGVSALRARQRFAEMEGDDTSIAMVRFVDGAVGTLVESFVMKSLSCLRTGQEPITSGRSQRRPLEIVLAAYDSMESGMPVTLPVSP